MTITLRSTIEKHSIVLPDWVDLSDGTEVLVSIEAAKGDSDEKMKLAKKLSGSWADDPSIDEIFRGIEKERHSYLGRDNEFDVHA